MNGFDKITFVSAQALLQGTELNNLVREGEKTNALGEVFNASKDLYDYLLEKDASLKKVHELIETKTVAAERFKEATGLVWKL